MANERDTGQGPAIGEVKERIEREAAATRETAQQLGEQVQRQAKEMSADIQSEGQRLASEQKEVATSSLLDLASAIRNAADELERRQQTQVANMARTLAGGLEDFSRSIRQRNFQDMMSDVQRFARDHPAVFFGGALLAGLAVARFTKSTSPRMEQPRQMSEFARHEREQDRGVEAGMTR